MLSMLAFCAAVSVLAIAGDSPSRKDLLEAYQERAATTGRDAGAQVSLALWCDAHGLEAERVKHLARAVLINPNHAAARALLGVMSYAGKWRHPEEVAATVQRDENLVARLAEYNRRRELAHDTADSQWKLALWCEQNGLEAEARAHFTTVTRLDPQREAAWVHLGCKRHNGRWLTPAQIHAEKTEAELQLKADHKWLHKLEAYKHTLAARGAHDVTERAFAEVSDPRAVRAVVMVFGHGGESDLVHAVQLLSQIDAPAATIHLATLSVFSPSPRIRKLAIATLLRRDPRDFVGRLIDLIQPPLKYEVKDVNGPGRPGSLFVRGEQFNIRMIYPAPVMPGMMRPPLSQVQPQARPALRTSRLIRELHGEPGDAPARQILRVSHPGGGHPGLGSTHLTAPSPFNIMPYAQVNTIPGLMHGMNPQFQGNPLPAPMSLPNHGLNPPAIPSHPQPFVPPYYAVPSIAVSSGFRSRLNAEQTLEQRAVARASAIALNWMEAQQAALSSEEQLQNDLLAVRTYNDSLDEGNRRVLETLDAVTGQKYGTDRDAWKTWWSDQNGYVYTPDNRPKPTIEQVASTYQPIFVPVPSLRIHNSCFAAGTTVRTRDGDRPIENLKVGDQLVAEDTQTGVLSFQPIVQVFHNPPAATLRLDLAGNAVVATGIHRFWRAGRGWVMARDLESGDVVRTLGGIARVESVTPEKVQPVFNLEIAEGHTFFVGKPGALVHDNSLVEALAHPFDAAPTAPSATQ